MKGYILVKGQFSGASIDDLKPTLLGITDPTNHRNTVSLFDIMSNMRIAQTVYNLGLKLNATSYLINPDMGIQYFGVTYTFRESINRDAFTEITIPVDLWNILDENDNLVEEEIGAVCAAIRKACPDLNDTSVIESMAKKLAMDGYNLLLEQFNVSTGNAEGTQLYLQEGTLTGDTIKNLIINQPSINRDNVMRAPTEKIPLNVPSFYDLICYTKYKEAQVEKELLEFGSVDDGDDESPEGYETEDTASYDTTSYFGGGDISYKDIYKPYYSYEARTTLTHPNGAEVPLINPDTIKVANVTQFWEVYPADQIPEDAFGRCADGTKYHLNDLTGHPENNHLELQTNETPYYRSLVELLKVAISIEHNALSDEIYNEVSDRYSEVVEEYCKTLAEQAFNLMWCHTGTTQAIYPNDYEDPDSKDDGDDTSADVVTYINLHCHYGTILPSNDRSSYVFQPFYKNLGLDSDAAIRNELRVKLPRLYLGFDGNSEIGIHHDGALVGYVNQNPSNRRWIDTLIRLLRWGERKPSMLSWEHLDATESDVATNKYWNLNTASVSTHDGNIDNHTPVTNERIGNPYELVAVVYADIIMPKGAYENVYGPSGFDGGQINVHVPIGVKLQSKYESGDMYKITYEDIFTYHSKIKNGNPNDARGHIVFDGANYVDITGDIGTLVPQESLVTAMRLIDAKSITQTIDGRETLFAINVSSNPELIEKRGKILERFSDTTAALEYRTKSTLQHIFNSISQFTLIAMQANFLTVGKKFAESVTGGVTGALGINPENARIVYEFLARFVKLNYVPVTGDGDGVCDLAFILKMIDGIENPATTEEPAEDEEPCWIDFLRVVGDKAEQYVFCELKTPYGIAPVCLALSRDRANKQLVFLSHKELDYLKDRGYKAIIKTVNYEKKYQDTFARAVQLWNSKGKNVTTCQHGNTLISSNEAMRLISEFLA